MKRIMSIIIMTAAAAVVISCNDGTCSKKGKAMNQEFDQEKAMVNSAISNDSNDYMQVEQVGDNIVFTHIYDGIIDVKLYSYEGDTCVMAERVYVYPDQKSALRHFRRAVEHAQLYDNIQLFKNEVHYKLKEAQHKLETEGLTKEQLKAKFEKQIADIKKHM